MDLLTVNHLEKAFGGVTAISNLSFRVPKGIVYSVIGPNGAGKTTLFNMLCGFYLPDNGTIEFQPDTGETILLHSTPTFKIAESGISRTFQNLQIFFNMTALENVMVGCHLQSNCSFVEALFRTRKVRTEEKRVHQQALEALAFCKLEDLANETADSLPYGHLKRLEIARALASKPQLLMMDEPAAGLNDTETREMSLLIRRICNAGTSVLLVEHNMDLVMKTSDQILVINFGGLLAEGTPEEIQRDSAVIHAYLGGDMKEAANV